MELDDDPEAPLLLEKDIIHASDLSSGSDHGMGNEAKYLPPSCESDSRNDNNGEDNVSEMEMRLLGKEPHDASTIDTYDEGGSTCFICLADEEGSDVGLVRCCTQCYTRVHSKCWKDWRNNQRITVLRSHLLGLRTPRNTLLCSICKTGQAKVPDEDMSELEWLDTLGEDGSTSEDQDELGQFVDAKMCSSKLLLLNGILLVAVVITSILAVTLGHYYTGDIVLFTFIGVYEVGILQILALMVIRRRQRPVDSLV